MTIRELLDLYMITKLLLLQLSTPMIAGHVTFSCLYLRKFTIVLIVSARM